MRCLTLWGLLGVLAACEARINGAPADSATPDTPPPGDAVAPPPDGEAFGPWSTAATVSVAESAAVEDDVTLSSNTLEMVFAIDPLDGNGKDLYYSSRPSPTGAWSEALKLPFNSTTTSDETPRMSADDKTLYFASGRANNGTLDIWKATRAVTGTASWGTPEPVDSVNSKTQTEKWFAPCGTDHYLMIVTRNGLGDLVEGTLGGGAATPVSELNSPQNETGVFVTQDCLTAFFASARVTPTMIYTAHRASLTAPWQDLTQVTDFLATGGNQEDPWLSPDGHTFAFASDAAGSKDVYLSTR